VNEGPSLAADCHSGKSPLNDRLRLFCGFSDTDFGLDQLLKEPDQQEGFLFPDAQSCQREKYINFELGVQNRLTHSAGKLQLVMSLK